MNNELQGQIDQLIERLGLEWTYCPRGWSAYTDDEREKNPWGHGYCSNGIITFDYNEKRTCEACKGAGRVFK